MQIFKSTCFSSQFSPNALPRNRAKIVNSNISVIKVRNKSEKNTSKSEGLLIINYRQCYAWLEHNKCTIYYNGIIITGRDCLFLFSLSMSIFGTDGFFL